MYASHLSLIDFRSYPAVDVEFAPGVNTLIGPNGQGKTNLVEALGYVATLSSHRVSSDAALVRAGASRAIVRARIVRGDRASTVELEINPGKSNRARINRAPAGRARDVLGIARTVLFAPEDLALVKGDPDGRRRFLDQLGILLVPRYVSVLSDYDRVLRQRSALLKSFAGGRGRGRGARVEMRDEDPERGSFEATLDVWNGRMAALGAQITDMRRRLSTALRPYVHTAYEQVSAGQGDAVIGYRSSVDESLGSAYSSGESSAEETPSGGLGSGDPAQQVADLERRMIAAMDAMRAKEIERGVSLVGPHRDDLNLALGELPAKGYASHGESWSLALALRLASYRLLTDGHDAVPWASEWGEDGEPILVLDDVFAELDVRRRERLAQLVAPARQVFITAAVPDDVPAVLAGTRFTVGGGEVTRA